MADKELIGIQYLRGLAAVLVVMAHTTGMARFPKYFNFSILSGYFELGTVGVELFFVISGFIISFVALEKDSLQPKTDSRTFFKRRFVRIIPFMWVCIIGFAILRLWSRGYFPWPSYLRSFILFPIGRVEPTQIWTLRHEFLFYILFSVFILQSKQQWKWIILWFLSPIIWIPIDLHTVSNNILIQLGDFIFSRHNILFGVGCAIGILYKKNYLKFKVITSYGYMMTIVSVVPLLLVLQYMREVLWLPMLVQEFIIGVVCFGIVVLSIAIGFSKELNLFSQLGKILGDASYSIYLTHGVVVAALLGWWSKIQPSANSVVVLVVITVASCFAGIVAHLFVERPLIKIIQQRILFK